MSLIKRKKERLSQNLVIRIQRFNFALFLFHEKLLHEKLERKEAKTNGVNQTGYKMMTLQPSEMKNKGGLLQTK